MSSRAIVLNCPIDLCTKEEALECARLAIEANTDYQIITINPEMIMNAQNNEDFLKALVEKAGGIICGRMCILAEGDAIKRSDIVYLEKLPLFTSEGEPIWE